MSKLNEKDTESLTKELLINNGYKLNVFDDCVDFISNEQITDNPIIDKLLKNASKSGNGRGKPEFLIKKKDDNKFLIVIECKADNKFHGSKNLDQYRDYAVDGALLYASYLSKEFDTIAIGISGVTKETLKISTYLHPKNASKAELLKDKNGKEIVEFLKWEDYLMYAKRDHTLAGMRFAELMKFSRDLHNYMRDYCKISENEKPLLVSGILIALMDDYFENGYISLTAGNRLANEIVKTITAVLEKNKVESNKIKLLENQFSFIEHHPELSKFNEKTGETPLYHVVKDLADHVKPFIQDHYDFDVIGNFYGEFIRYTGGDKKGLGIVLTPKHIAELFVDIAKVNKNSTVLDTCTGTAGFLIASMKKMLEMCETEAERKRVKSDALIGIEQDPKMYALAVSNMILRGDGKTNLYQGSCFDSEIMKKANDRAEFGFINPPYSQKGDNLHEWDFILNMLDALKKGGTGIVIVPMSMAIANHPLRERLLKNHRLEAVMSMPDDLFYPVGVVTCVMVFTTHTPHESDPYHETWFGYWKNDGFIKDRREGRVPKSKEQWKLQKEEWVKMYRRKDIPGIAVWKKVGIKDEWCAEAYLETNYDDLTDEDFQIEVKKYLAFQVKSSDKLKF
jgi:type I restriction enzyme M protein